MVLPSPVPPDPVERGRAAVRPLLTREQLAADELWQRLSAAADIVRTSPTLLEPYTVPVRTGIGSLFNTTRVLLDRAIDAQRLNELLAECGLSHQPIIETSSAGPLHRLDGAKSTILMRYPNGKEEEIGFGGIYAHMGGDYDTLETKASRVAFVLDAWKCERELQLVEAAGDWFVLGVLSGNLQSAWPLPTVAKHHVDALAARLRHLARQQGIVSAGGHDGAYECVADWVVSAFGVRVEDVSRVPVVAIVQALERGGGGRGASAHGVEPARRIVVRYDPAGFQDATGNPRTGGRVPVEAGEVGKPSRAWRLSRQQFDLLRGLVEARARVCLPETECGRSLARRFIDTLSRLGVRAQRPPGGASAEVELVDEVRMEADPEIGRRDLAAALRRFRDATRGQVTRGEI